MEIKKITEIINECDLLFDTLSNEELTTWNFLKEVNNIVSKYKGIDCLTNFNFANGNIIQCMCIITDWQPGALVFQSDNGDIPMMRLVYPEEYVEFMNKIQPIFDSDYPDIPEDQKEE
ncbi:MAG: hypothetical protein E7157_04675 [Lactobacillales bacterium]|nr:hypothetical protein [Lactobacillales bacterium]